MKYNTPSSPKMSDSISAKINAEYYLTNKKEGLVTAPLLLKRIPLLLEPVNDPAEEMFQHSRCKRCKRKLASLATSDAEIF